MLLAHPLRGQGCRLYTPLSAGGAARKRCIWKSARPARPLAAPCASGASGLAAKRCAPCEGDGGALQFMGLCEALGRGQAEELLQQLDAGWSLGEDAEGCLRLRREWRTKNFLRALELCDRIGEVAEAEGHHPDLHLTGWNRLEVELQTHARRGLTENDFILAAKIDAVPTEGLLRGKKKSFADV